MNAQRFNRHIAAGRVKADANLPALERGYRITLQAAARHAGDRFAALATDHLTADATDPKWTPPENDQLIDPDGMATDAQKRTKVARLAALKAVMAPALADIGIAFDLTNPLVAGLIGKLAVRASDMNAAVQGEIAKAILAAYQQGLSVAATAKEIQAAVEGVATARAAMLARTDLVGLANGASVAAAQLVDGSDTEGAGFGFKQWLATADERTRETHSAADGQIVPLDDTFAVGDDQLAYPGDPDGSDEEVINCRCTVVYLDASEAGGVTAAMQAPTGDVTSQGLMDESPDDTTAAVTVTVDGDAPADMAGVEVRWQAVLCVEGVQTEDGRMLENGSITWRDLPLSLGAMFETPHAYEASAEICGRIDAIWRNGNQIMGSGVFGSDEVGQRAAEMVANLTLRGVSVDLGVLAYELREADPPVATDETNETADEEADIADVITEIDNLVFVVTEGVIGAATVCPFQAIAGATIAVVAAADSGEQHATAVMDTCFVLAFDTAKPDRPIGDALAVLEATADADRIATLERMLAQLAPLVPAVTTLAAAVESLEERSAQRETLNSALVETLRGISVPLQHLDSLTDALTASVAREEASGETAKAVEILIETASQLALRVEQQESRWTSRTQDLVASVDALAARIESGGRVDDAIIETVRSMAGPRAVTFKRDESGRLSGISEN